MDQADLWTPHLRADERVLWQAETVEKRYLAELSRQRKLGLFILVVALIAAILFGVSLVELLDNAVRSGLFMASLNSWLLTPIYVVAILACLAIAFGQVSRFNPRRPAVARYAVTTARVLALGADGALVDQLEGLDVAAVALTGPDNARSLTIRRKPGEASQAPFVIAYADHPGDAKAAIEQAFLQQPG